MKRVIPSVALVALTSLLPASFAAEPTAQERLPLEELRIFADVFNQIRASYVEEVDDRTLMESAVRGMLAGLDPHSVYLDARSYDDLQSSTTGEFGGLGLEVGMENGFVKVISPIDDTPAARAGIEAGDLIIELDGEQVKGMSLQDAVNVMRGPKGSKITLTIVREGVPAPFKLTLTRDVITVQSVRSRTLEPGYGYIRVAQFQIKTGADLKRELAKLKTINDPLKGLVLDLRNNPGGLLQAAIQISDVFLDEGLIVYTEGRLPSSHSRYEASAQEPADATPMVVLINGGSASASEIVAGALQDHKRALVLGTKSFGKGSVQTVLPLSQDRAIKLTTARYFTPNGRSIQAHGIAPDIVIQRARIEAIAPLSEVSEASLHGHLENGSAPATTLPQKENTEIGELAKEDNQLFEALNVLKGLHFMQQRAAK